MSLSQSVLSSIERGIENLIRLQRSSGAWDGDYGGPVFLVPMYVALHWISQTPILPRRRQGIIDYLFSIQNSDGSIGLHYEGEGTLFSTATSYAVLRYLGLDGSDQRMKRMLDWIHEMGTPLGCAQWGKFLLALLNLYDYEGLNPIPPELWILPQQIPFHPSHLWCHAREVYLPMSWLYGTKAKIKEDALIHQLRKELYDKPYETIVFSKYRDFISPQDNYFPLTPMLKTCNRILHAYEKTNSKALRRYAMSVVLDHIIYEDKTTDYVNLGPVNAILNRIVHYFRDPTGEAFRKAYPSIEEYVFEDEGGKCWIKGYQSTEVWDTVFATQSILASPFYHNCKYTLEKANDFLKNNQVLENTPQFGRYFRHPSKGGWPFSTRRHGWPITDCTAEGIKTTIMLRNLVSNPISDERLDDAVNLLLTFQNDDGGFASYERCRGSRALELLNPSNIFCDIMIDYSYVECTSSVIQGLMAYKKAFPHKSQQITDTAIHKALGFLKRAQRPDGSFYGSWGVCFTYGTWFGVSGMISAGEPPTSTYIQKAVDFLIKHQRQDGSFGEHYSSCLHGSYVDLGCGHPVMTSWALLALVRAGYEKTECALGCVKYLINSQNQDGSWKSPSMSGVFNKTCLINYDNYRHYFPVWALSEYLKKVQNRT